MFLLLRSKENRTTRLAPPIPHPPTPYTHTTGTAKKPRVTHRHEYTETEQIVHTQGDTHTHRHPTILPGDRHIFTHNTHAPTPKPPPPKVVEDHRRGWTLSRTTSPTRTQILPITCNNLFFHWYSRRIDNEYICRAYVLYSRILHSLRGFSRNGGNRSRRPRRDRRRMNGRGQRSVPSERPSVRDTFRRIH